MPIVPSIAPSERGATGSAAPRGGDPARQAVTPGERAAGLEPGRPAGAAGRRLPARPPAVQGLPDLRRLRPGDGVRLVAAGSALAGRRRGAAGGVVHRRYPASCARAGRRRAPPAAPGRDAAGIRQCGAAPGGGAGLAGASRPGGELAAGRPRPGAAPGGPGLPAAGGACGDGPGPVGLRPPPSSAAPAAGLQRARLRGLPAAGRAWGHCARGPGADPGGPGGGAGRFGAGGAAAAPSACPGGAGESRARGGAMSGWPSLLLWVTLLAPLPLGRLALRHPPRQMRRVVPVLGALPLTTLLLLSRMEEGGLQGPLSLGGLALQWRLDPLAALLLLLTQLVLLASATCGVGPRGAALPDEAARARFWALLGGLGVAVGLIWVAADLLLLYVGLELMGLTAVGMMLLPGKAEAIRAGLRYLLYALVGSLAWLLGVALLLGAWGTLSLAELAAVAEPDAVTRIAMALLAGGCCLRRRSFRSTAGWPRCTPAPGPRSAPFTVPWWSR